MIDEIVISAGETARIHSCRSIFYAGATRRTAFASPVLVRSDDQPSAGVEIVPGQGMYWPQNAHGVSIENPDRTSPEYTGVPVVGLPARVLWSDDTDITRPLPAARSMLLYAARSVTLVTTGLEAELFRAAIVPTAVGSGVGPEEWGNTPEMEAFGSDYLLPSGPTRRAWSRSTVGIYNTGPGDVTFRLYGIADSEPVAPGGFADLELLATRTVLATEHGRILAEIEGYSALLLSYFSTLVGTSATVMWELHEGGTFDGYTKDEVDAFLALYMPLAGGTFRGPVTFQGAAQVVDRVSVYLSGAQAIATGAAVKVLLNAENFDTGGHFASNRFTAVIAGYYQVSVGAWVWQLNTGKTWMVIIYKNGASWGYSRQRASANTTYLAGTVSRLIHLDVDEYVELFVFHDHGSNRFCKEGQPTFMTVLGPF